MVREQRGSAVDVKRAHFELFARHMEAEGRMRSTVRVQLHACCEHNVFEQNLTFAYDLARSLG